MIRIAILIILLGILCTFPMSSGATSDYPCHPSWIYSNISGNCYFIENTKLNWTQAKAECDNKLKTVLPSTTITSRLGKIRTVDDAKALSKILSQRANYEMQWTSGFRSSAAAPYLWSDTTAVTTDADLWNDNPGAGNCIIYEHRPIKNNVWATFSSMKSENCDQEMAYYCEHEAKACVYPNPAVVPLYNATTMELFPDRTTIRSLVRVLCRPGYYRYSELSYATTIQPVVPSSSGMNRDQINCTGTASADYDPAKYVSNWNAQALEVCKPVKCTIMNGSLNNVDNQPRISPGQASAIFPYTYEFRVNCSYGYVNYLNRTRIVASMQCGQSPEDKSQGLWVPEDYNACIGVKCNKTEMENMKPADGSLIKAIHKITQREYKSFEVNQFNQYDNIVTIRCATGYFFPDRSFEKMIICGLKKDSRIDGEWVGYSGTVLPIFKICKPVECKFEDVQLMPKLLIEPYFFATYPNGTLVNKTSHNGNAYPYQVVLRFFCIEGYDSSNKNQDQNVTCGPKGTWIPLLTPCIQRTDKLDTGNKKFFVPKPEEAPAAQEVGAIVIIILVIFLVLIVILDLSTLTRDVKIMGNNLRQLRRRISKKKNVEAPAVKTD